MFQKWDEARRHRHKLFWRHVHVMHLRRIDFEEIASIAHRNFFPREMTASIDRSIRLRDKEVFLPVCGEIFNLVRDPAIHDLAIRGFDKAEFIDTRERAHGTDQADVWTFRRFDRTNTTVVRWMNVTHLESGALTA